MTAWHGWLPEAQASLPQQVQCSEEHQAPRSLQLTPQARCCAALGRPQQRCQGLLLPEQSLQQPRPVLHLKLGQAGGRGAPAGGCTGHSQPCSLQLMHCPSPFMHAGRASTRWASPQRSIFSVRWVRFCSAAGGTGFCLDWDMTVSSW